jgi:TIR domain-containing protein
MTTSRIFISYRRGDSSGHAGRLYDRLVDHFGIDRVFMDVDTIEPGVDFVDALRTAVGSCAVLIALIGDDWLDATDAEGHRRLDDPNDFVRTEIATALARNIVVVPVLIERAARPSSQQLPADLQKLTRIQDIEVRDAHWRDDVNHLIDTLKKTVPARTVEVSDTSGKSSSADTSNVPDRRRVSWAAVIAFVTFLVVIVSLMGAGSEITASDALDTSFVAAISLIVGVVGVRATRKPGNELKGAWMAWTAAIGSALLIVYFILAIAAQVGSGR